MLRNPNILPVYCLYPLKLESRSSFDFDVAERVELFEMFRGILEGRDILGAEWRGHPNLLSFDRQSEAFDMLRSWKNQRKDSCDGSHLCFVSIGRSSLHSGLDSWWFRHLKHLRTQSKLQNKHEYGGGPYSSSLNTRDLSNMSKQKAIAHPASRNYRMNPRCHPGYRIAGNHIRRWNGTKDSISQSFNWSTEALKSLYRHRTHIRYQIDINSDVNCLGLRIENLWWFSTECQRWLKNWGSPSRSSTPKTWWRSIKDRNSIRTEMNSKREYQLPSYPIIRVVQSLLFSLKRLCSPRRRWLS